MSFGPSLFAHPPDLWAYHEDSSSLLTNVLARSAPAAGQSIYVGTIVLSTNAGTAMTLTLKDGDGNTVIGPLALEAVAGRGAVILFDPPRKLPAAKSLTVSTSAAIAHSIDITGYIAPG